MTAIVIIPARGGSKRIPRKNIRALDGKPIICHTIESLKTNALIETIYVSTDDPEIEEITEALGVQTINRPADLSTDVSTTLEVMAHAVREIYSHKEAEFRNVFCVYPINPFLNQNYLIKAIEIIETTQLDYIFTAKMFPSPIQRALMMNEQGNAEMVNRVNAITRTQDLESRYHDVGMFYLAKAKTWENKKPIFEGRSRFIEIKKYESVDVDDEEDWIMMERLYSAKKLEQHKARK